MLGLIWLLIILGYLLVASVQTGRPLATAAGWMFGIAVLLLWFGLTPPPTARAIAWSVPFTVAGLALAAAYLAREGRPAEIALWLPAILAGLVGWVYLLAAVFDQRARWPRGVLAALFLAVPISLWGTIGHWTGVGF